MRKLAVILLISIFFTVVMAETYDGLWLVGFNLKKDIWQGDQGKQNRLIVAQAIDRANMAEQSGEKQAISVIYPLSNSYIPEKDFIEYSAVSAVSLNLKVVILHTDGVKTKKIAELLQKNLNRLNIEVIAKETRMDETWERSLRSGDYDIFLMGFKADYNGAVESYLEPLFSTNGYANFMGYSNQSVDTLIQQLKQASESDRVSLLKTLNNTIYQDLPIVPIFYIEKI